MQNWSQSVSNHLYWCAASSNGNGDLVVEKWLSILRHVTDIHTNHSDLFPNCLHGSLEPRLWIQPGSKAHMELVTIASNKNLCKDLKRLSPAQQTSALESYHKIVTFFAPKSVHFFYSAMEARVLLAALHFNENSNRAQAVNKQGDACWNVSFPKSRHGEPVVKDVKIPLTYNYINELLDEVFQLRSTNQSYSKARNLHQESSKLIPLPIASSHEKMDKKQLIIDHKKRFNK